jgi:hypothetical protein
VTGYTLAARCSPDLSESPAAWNGRCPATSLATDTTFDDFRRAQNAMT